MASLREYREEQLMKLKQLESKGFNLYPAQARRDMTLKAARDNFKALQGSAKWLAGRLMALRQHGQITFLDISDETAHLQLIVRQEALESAQSRDNQLKYEDLNLLTRGDFINVYGSFVESKHGEKSLEVSEVKILAKVLRPLPQKLTDTETRRRRRYLDTAINPEIRSRFRRRAFFWQHVRQFLNGKGFLEINIPVLEHTTGGGEARPFKTRMRALNEDFYLRISHELPLKKLLGGGYEKVYDIGPRFRNEHYSDEHLPEHVALEWYWAYADWQDGMALMEALFKTVSHQVFGKTKFDSGAGPVDFEKDWPKLDYAKVMRQHYDIDIFNVELKTVTALLRKHGLEIEKTDSLASALDKLFKNIRTGIAGPCWLIHLPTFMSPLSKEDADKPGCVQRFQAIIGGSELCNGFSELNDPRDQLARMQEQQTQRDSGNEEAQMLDLDFIEMLEYGMPPACGIGFSERAFWFLEGVSAREGVPFNHFRRETDPNSREIYPHLFTDGGK